MTEISEFQQKRACNIIWNAAGNYDFAPEFKAYEGDGTADLYFNCIIGSVHRYYDYARISELFKKLRQYEDAYLYCGILWIGLENGVYPKASAERPALKSLRK